MPKLSEVVGNCITGRKKYGSADPFIILFVSKDGKDMFAGYPGRSIHFPEVVTGFAGGRVDWESKIVTLTVIRNPDYCLSIHEEGFFKKSLTGMHYITGRRVAGHYIPEENNDMSSLDFKLSSFDEKRWISTLVENFLEDERESKEKIYEEHRGKEERENEERRKREFLEHQEAEERRRRQEAEQRERDAENAAKEAERQKILDAEEAERKRREAEEAFWNSPEGQKVRAAQMLAEIERQKSIDQANIRIREQEELAKIARIVRDEERESQNSLIEQVKNL